MFDWILKYWVEVLFGATTSLFCYITKRLSTKIKKEQEINAAIVVGMQALLRTKLTEMCERYTDLGYCPTHVKENVDDVYKAYHAIGGNGAGTAAYQHVMDLPEILPQTAPNQSESFVKIT